MAKINCLNNSLSSQTGTGNFCGNNSSIFTGNNDLSGANSIKIPANSSPSLTVTGQIALDTSITGYPSLIKYYNGSQEMAMVSMLSSDFTTTDGDVIQYDSALNKLKMASLPATSVGKLVQVVNQRLTSNATTNSTTITSTGLTANITPLNSANRLVILFNGYSILGTFSGTRSQNIGFFYIRRTTGTATNLSELDLMIDTATSVSTSQAFDTFSMAYVETAGSTALHTYVITYEVSSIATYMTLAGASMPASLTILEIEP